MSLSSFFKTFAAIHKQAAPLESRLADHQRYYAHLHEQKEPELLADHTALVAAYALKLITAHHLDSIVDGLIKPLVNSKENNAAANTGNFIKTLFWNAVLFHDYGKVNENFQAERMNNTYFKRNPVNKIGSRHSVLSALIYIGEHFRRLFRGEFSPKDQNLLGTLTLLFTSVILKHHAPYLEEELNIPPELVDNLLPYLEKFGIQMDPQKLKAAIERFQIEPDFRRLMDSLPAEATRFPLYALLRLCFSLLTASDYYATSNYTIEMEVNDFGTLTVEQKERFQYQFRKTRYYNRLFFENEAYFKSLKVEELLVRSPENLNLLRQKLMAEVLDNASQHAEGRVFYLEAPTGSGKTNLSLAIALKMLQRDETLNKLFYVFPFTTLITQTARSIQETLQVSNAEMIQWHSRSGFHTKREKQQENKDGQYGAEYLNYVDNLFINYPLVLMTHIKFFDILKGNGKGDTYILHRLANSVVIIDELQSYPPEEWDKITYFLTNFANYFNIRFVLMSATLPKLDALNISGKNPLSLSSSFISLVKDSANYFRNPNFGGRVRFDFSLLPEQISVEELADTVYEKCEAYACEHQDRVKCIVEFILKQRAGEFNEFIRERMEKAGYEVMLLSGTILEPRRREIIEGIKAVDQQPDTSQKLLLLTTQVVEAGVDIDMDIGFKDRSLIDSDEQLAGRVNRNARATIATVYLFRLDRAFTIYGKDLRYKLTRNTITEKEYRNILENKRFDLLYQRVCDYINLENANEYIRGINTYLEHFKYLHLAPIDHQFKLIAEQTLTVYVPLEISVQHFADADLAYLQDFGIAPQNEMINGADVWRAYTDIVTAQTNEFIRKRIDLKRIYGIMAQFMFSIHANSHLVTELKRYSDVEVFDKYKMLYLSHWEEVYDYQDGIREEQFSEPMVLI